MIVRSALELAGDLVTRFEGLRLFAYPDPASPLAAAARGKNWGREPAQGILESLPPDVQTLRGDPWTVGYGATGNAIGPGTFWTAEQARADLDKRLLALAAVVERLAPRAKSKPYQIAALVSLAYNIGTGALSNSTLLRKLNAGDEQGASQQFDVWVNAGGKRMVGLVMRRAAERALFEGR